MQITDVIQHVIEQSGQGVAEGMTEGTVKDAESALAKHGQYKVDYEKKYGPMNGADLHQHEVIRKQLLDKKRRSQSDYNKKMQRQDVAEGQGWNIDSEDYDVFTPEEIAKIKKSHFPEKTRENLLAAKEAAKKLARFNSLRGGNDSESNLGSALGGSDNTYESLGKNIVKSIKVGNFRHDLVNTGMGWQVRIYNGDELYDTGLSKNSEQKGLGALEDAVAYTEKQTRTKRQDVAEGAPELLKAEMPLVRHIERELVDKGWQKSDDGYDKVFKSAMAMYRKFGNVDAIKKQDVVEGLSWKSLDIDEDTKHTFGGKDPLSFKSPKGGTPVMMIVTQQGSRYLIANDGMVLRLKSFHANTGGEDQGLKNWTQHIEFYDPTEKLGGTTFPLAVSMAVEKGLTVSLGKTSDNKRVLLIFKDNAWKPAKISDIFKFVATQDVPMVATYSKTPKLNWNPLDYNLNANNTLKSVHPGSPVSHGVSLSESIYKENNQNNGKKNTDMNKPNKLTGTPTVSLKDFGDKDYTKNKYGQTVPKTLKKDDPRVKFSKQDVPEATGDLQFDKMMGNITKPSAVKALGREEKIHELIRKYYWHKRRADLGQAVTGEYGHDKMVDKVLMALKKMNVDLSKMDPLKLRAIKGEVYESEGDDRGDYNSTARSAYNASMKAKSKKSHELAADLHSKAATYALSAGKDSSTIHDHQMAAHEHIKSAKKMKNESLTKMKKSEKQINECGEMGPGLMNTPHTPARIDISADNGQELTNMLKDIMSLAGVNKTDVEPISTTPASVEPSEPAQIEIEPVDSMRSVLDKLHDVDGEQDSNEPGEDEPFDADSNDDEDLEEYDNTPDQTMVGQTNDLAHHENQPGQGDRLDGIQPKAYPGVDETIANLFMEYKKYVEEGAKHASRPGTQDRPGSAEKAQKAVDRKKEIKADYEKRKADAEDKKDVKESVELTVDKKEAQNETAEQLSILKLAGLR